MKLIEYQQEFTALNGKQYQIGIAIQDPLSQLSDFGYSTQSLPIGTIEDITDINYKYEDMPVGAPSALNCKVSLFTDLIPNDVYDAMTGTAMATYEYNNMNIYIPNSFLYIREFDGSAYQTKAILCQQAQSSVKEENGSMTIEITFIELAKHIAEQVKFDNITFNASAFNVIEVSDNYVDLYRHDSSANKDYYKLIETNDNEKFVFVKLFDFHKKITLLMRNLAVFYFGTNLIPNFEMPTPEQWITQNNKFYKQSGSLNSGSQLLNDDEIYILGFIKNGSDVVDGRLLYSAEKSLFKKYTNAYNYLAELADYSSSRLIFDLTETKFHIDLIPLSTSAIPIDLSKSDVYSAEREIFNFNRYIYSSSAYDNLEYDVEEIKENNNLSENAEKVEIPMIWNNRPQSNNVDMNSEGNIAKSKHIVNSNSRYTDLYYYNSSTSKIIKVHPYCCLNLGVHSWDLSEWYIENRASISNDVEYVWLDDIFAINIQNNMGLMNLALNAASKRVINHYFTITTNLEQFNYFNIPSSKDTYILPFHNYFKRQAQMINHSYFIIESSVKSLKTGEIEIKFGML